MDFLKEFGPKKISAHSKKYWSWTVKKSLCYQFDKKKGTKRVAQKLFYQVWTYRDMSIVKSQLNLMSQKLVGSPSFIS
jgi:hypothetical protein